ncbi:nucleotidyltransferase domain-containing protein [archaeon]|nr:nucleotidyltransferase domain-containing protein [archaeon]
MIEMKSQPKIIKFFADHKDEHFSINSVAKFLKLNYRIAFEEIKKLESDETLAVKKFGNTNQCSFNYHFNEKVLTVENEKRDSLLKNKDIKALYDRLIGLKNPFFICLVFGSYAKGSQTKHSDIDLCIITDNEEVKRKAEQIIRTLPLKIHLLSFTTKEFASMLKTTDQNVGKEIVKNNIILKDVESFYEMVNYAR